MTQTLAEELAQITQKSRKKNDQTEEEKQQAALKADRALRKEARLDALEMYPEMVAEIKKTAAKGQTNYRRYFGNGKYYLYLLEEVARMLKAEGLQAEAHFLKATGI